jgi:hypothetical protein
MDDTRRAWIYGGLALAEGVGLVAPSARSARARKNPVLYDLAVWGDELAQGLAVPLKQLVGGRTTLACHGRPDSRLSDWLRSGWARDLGQTVRRPTLLLAAFQWDDPEDMSRMSEAETLLGPHGEVVWLIAPSTTLGTVEVIANGFPNPERLFRSDELDLQLGPDGRHPTAAGYAGWAGAIWAWIT